MSAKLFLNALVSPNWSLQRPLHLRTAGFSNENLDALLESGAAAITVSSPGALNAELLLDALAGMVRMQPDQDKPELFGGFADSRNTALWHWYAIKAPRRQQVDPVNPVDRNQLLSLIDELSSQVATSSAVYAIVPELALSPEREHEIRERISRVIERSLTGIKIDASDDSTDRKRLIDERERMMNEVGVYSSERLAGLARSTTTNPSQLAADQRKAGKIFGMKHGPSWKYPEFQFDHVGQVLPEVEAVVKALSPDEQGWDRLRWFLEPHEKLGGRTPLQVWRTDRQKVVEAASTERWDGRD